MKWLYWRGCEREEWRVYLDGSRRFTKPVSVPVVDSSTHVSCKCTNEGNNSGKRIVLFTGFVFRHFVAAVKINHCEHRRPGSPTKSGRARLVELGHDVTRNLNRVIISVSCDVTTFLKHKKI